MPTISSLDPRIKRASIPTEQEIPFEPKEQMDQFQTFEVFVQTKSGGHHAHVGSVHAPSPEMAMSYAKEQYGRRGQIYNIWVAQTSAVYSLDLTDHDFFENNAEKSYREVTAYTNTRQKIDEFKQSQS